MDGVKTIGTGPDKEGILLMIMMKMMPWTQI